MFCVKRQVVQTFWVKRELRITDIVLMIDKNTNKNWRLVMKQYLLPETGNFYKANMHTHTVCSDGIYTPEEIKEHYKSHGYSVVAYTDHDVMIDHSDLNDENFLAITSYEIETNSVSIGNSFTATHCYHLNFYAPVSNQTDYVCPNPSYCFKNAPKYAAQQDYYKGDYIRRYSVEGQNEMIAEARAKGYLVSYNHPDWSLQNYSDYIGLEGITAVEVYNTGCVVGGFVLDKGDHVLDHFLKAGKRIYPVATDDCHGNNDMCGGWVRFKADALTYDNILNAYAKGNFYASWGPEMESLYMENGVLKMDFPADSHVASVEVHTAVRWVVRRNGTDMIHAEIDLNDYMNEIKSIGFPIDRAYFRVIVTDDKGNKALTRGYFLDELE